MFPGCCPPQTSDSGCLYQLNGNCVTYTGPRIPSLAINPGDDLNTTIGKLATNSGGGGGGGGTTYSPGQGITFSGNVIELGQTVNASGSPSKFTVNREIDLDTFALMFSHANSSVGPQLIFTDAARSPIGSIKFVSGNNMYIGNNAGTNATGAGNTFVGASAGAGIIGGYRNIGLGYGAMQGNDTAVTPFSLAIVIGTDSLDTGGAPVGANNIVIGHDVLNSGNSVGINNIFIGGFINNSAGTDVGDCNINLGASNNMGGGVHNTNVLGQLDNGSFLIDIPNVNIIGSAVQNTILGYKADGTDVDLGQRLQVLGDMYVQKSIKLDPFTNTTPSNGQLWQDGSHLYFKVGGVQRQLDQQSAPPPTNPGVYVSPGNALNPTFIVFAAAIARINNEYVYHDIIDWEILEHTTGHNSSFITSIAGDPGSTQLLINYPTVKTVINGTITPDESFARAGVTVGGSIGFNQWIAPVGRLAPVGFRMTGTGGSGAGFTVSGINAPSLSFNYAGGTCSFNISNDYNTEYDPLSITYIGANNYGIRRIYSGLGIYNAAFQIIDRATGTVVTAPTSSDEVQITNAGIAYSIINMYQFDGTNAGFGSSFNFWIFGVFEAYLVAAATSPTSILVRWQPYGSGTTAYKIYRDTDPTFATQVLIYTGSLFEFTDTGLTTNTLYHYKMVAVISGTDTPVTTFTATPTSIT